MKSAYKVLLVLHCMTMQNAEITREWHPEIKAYSCISWNLVQGYVRKIALGNRQFQCIVCDKKGDASTISYNLHTQCYPHDGTLCIDCNENGKWVLMPKKYRDIVVHYTNEHSSLEKWTCSICNSKVDKTIFKKHMASYCNWAIAQIVFDELDTDIKIGKNERKYPLEKIWNMKQ